MSAAEPRLIARRTWLIQRGVGDHVRVPPPARRVKLVSVRSGSAARTSTSSPLSSSTRCREKVRGRRALDPDNPQAALRDARRRACLDCDVEYEVVIHAVARPQASLALPVRSLGDVLLMGAEDLAALAIDRQEDLLRSAIFWRSHAPHRTSKWLTATAAESKVVPRRRNVILRADA